MRRRDLVKAAAAGLAALSAPRLARAADRNVLRFVPQSDLASVDPVWTTADVTRNHGYLVYDTLYGLDDAYRPRPQMVEGHEVAKDGKSWTLSLRDGLRFHDGMPVRGADVVASLRRWAARDAFGRALLESTAELSAPSDRLVRFRLKRPFPLLLDALAKTASNMPCIMPERLAMTDPAEQVSEVVGSGPYRFVAGERVPGSRVVYERFAEYVPRTTGATSFTAGPKLAYFERVEWHVIPDAATAAGALQTGEIDWWETPTIELVPLLKRSGNIAVVIADPAAGIAIMRFNHLWPPFDNVAVRRALLGAIDQDDFMTAVAGADRTYWRDRVGVFTPGTPMATEAGIEALAGPRDLDKVRRDLAAAGYRGERVVVLAPVDFPSINALAQVGADTLRKVGMNVDLQTMDWASLVQRRTSKAAPAQRGWSVFFTYLQGTNNFTPAGQLGIRGNGELAWFGWPTSPRLEALRAEWLEAPDEPTRQRICVELQLQVWQDVPYIPLGAYFQPTAYRTALTGMRKGFPQFYDIRLR